LTQSAWVLTWVPTGRRILRVLGRYLYRLILPPVTCADAGQDIRWTRQYIHGCFPIKSCCSSSISFSPLPPDPLSSNGGEYTNAPGPYGYRTCTCIAGSIWGHIIFLTAQPIPHPGAQSSYPITSETSLMTDKIKKRLCKSEALRSRVAMIYEVTGKYRRESRSPDEQTPDTACLRAEEPLTG